MASLSSMVNRREVTPGEELIGIAKEGVNFIGAAKALGDQFNLDNASNKLLGIAKSRGGELSSLTFNDVGDIYDMQALGAIQKQQAENEAYRYQGMKNRFAADTEHYNQVIYPRMSLLQKAYQDGNLDDFANNVEELNNSLGTPYRLKRNADGTGFNMYFRKNGQGFVDTGRVLSNQEVYDMANQLGAGTQFVVSGLNGEKVAVNPHYNMWAERQRMNTVQGNIASALSPTFIVGPDKKMYRAVFQNRWNDYNADSDVILFDAQTGRKVGQFGASDLSRQGYFVPNMQTNTGLGGMQPEVIMPTGGGRRKNARTSTGLGLINAGMGLATGKNNGMGSVYSALYPDLFGKQPTGGRGGRSGGRGTGGRAGGVPGIDGGTPQQAGWKKLPTGAVGLINGLSTVYDENGKTVLNKPLAVSAKLLMQQTNLSPQAAVEQAKVLIDKYGPETTLNALQQGVFLKRGQTQQQQQPQLQQPQQHNPQSNNFAITPSEGIFNTRINKAIQGVQGGVAPQTVAQQKPNYGLTLDPLYYNLRREYQKNGEGLSFDEWYPKHKQFLEGSNADIKAYDSAAKKLSNEFKEERSKRKMLEDNPAYGQNIW